MKNENQIKMRIKEIEKEIIRVEDYVSTDCHRARIQQLNWVLRD